ncbi:hypothetical protein BDW75DRAFT_250010 [Aspergillus navahoensis]
MRIPAVPRTDHNVYTLGTKGNHNVVVVCLPYGVYGTVSASTAVSHMVCTYSNIQFGFIVGIGEGVPRKSADIRLGDIVGKTLHEGKLQRTGSLNKPPQLLLKAVSHIESDYLIGKRRVSDIVAHLLQKHFDDSEQFARLESDWLFNPTYNHKENGSNCSECDLHQLVHRTPWTTTEPYTHYGLIASGDHVMKDAKTRDLIAEELDILCFEMEAAGHNQWQGYAALTSAAYAKLLLSTEGSEFTAEEKECLQSLFLTDPAEDKNRLRGSKGEHADGTCKWILETDKLMHWLKVSETKTGKGSDVLWLYSNPGAGKCTMVVAMTDELLNQPWFANSKRVLAFFFCDSSSEKQRTAVSILRGLIYPLVKECPVLMRYLLPNFVERKEGLYTSFDVLWAILMEMARDRSAEVYCIIDALDKCELDSQQMLLRQVYQPFWAHVTTNSSSSRPHILITSRPYHEICGYLSCFRIKNLASYGVVKKDLQIMIQEKAKAEGTFLWVGIAHGELARPEAQSTMQPGSYALYRQLLNKALVCRDDNDDDKTTIVNLMRFVAFARRPLTVLEIADLCRLYPDDDEASRVQFTKELIDLCRLIIVIEDEHVRLLQKSVKDFLNKEELDIDELRAHAGMADRCIEHILNSIGTVSGKETTFFDYAVKYWPEHAGNANSVYVVSLEQRSLFEPKSKVWEKWIEKYNSITGSCHRWLEEGFCALHAAARWGVIPLMLWCLEIGAYGPKSSHGDKRTYKDAEFRTKSGLTPLEETARQGHVKLMDILLSRTQVGLKVSCNVCRAVASTWKNGKDIMALLLDQRGDQIQIAEDVLKAAAGNLKSGKDIMTLLLDRQGDQIQITEDVAKAAAGNEMNGTNIEMRFVLARQYGRQFTLLNDAARNWENGEDIMAALVDRRGSQIQITEDGASMLWQDTKYVY